MIKFIPFDYQILRPSLSTRFMRSWILVILLTLGLLPCRQVAAEEHIDHSTLLNLEVTGTLPGADLDYAHQRVRHLISLLENEVSSKIPSDIIIQVRSHPMKLVLTEDAATAEVFLDPDKSPNGILEIQMRPSYLLSDESDLLVAHAYFHALHYVMHPLEEPWIREGLAQVFEYVTTSRLNSSHIDAAFSTPTTPLMGEYVPDHINTAQYGHDLLYFYYLYQNCGKQSLFWKLTKGTAGLTGLITVENALKEMRAEDKAISQLPQCSSFQESANSFEIARALNHESAGSENTSRYYVRSGSHRRIIPLEKLTSDNRNRLKSLDHFEPMVFSFDTPLPAQELAGARRYWLHNEFPYEVQETDPSAVSADWVQLVVKP